MKFKVGDHVRIRKDSRFYDDILILKDLDGIITGIGVVIRVLFKKANLTDIYLPKDLEHSKTYAFDKWMNDFLSEDEICK